jgi:hypothetical protein
MNYDLAVQLKKAGFPQDYNFWHKYYTSTNQEYAQELGFIPYNKTDFDAVRVPTLSELIKACGEEFQVLFKGKNDMWTASSISMIFRHGKTPEEAVANLYLALHPIEPEV